MIFLFADDIALAETEVDLLSQQICPICIEVWNWDSFDNFNNILSSSTSYQNYDVYVTAIIWKAPMDELVARFTSSYLS